MILSLLAGPQDPGRVDDPGPETVALSWQLRAPWLSRSWDLTSLASPVIKLRGATGTGQVDPTHWWSEAPQVDGASWEGLRIGKGEVFIPLEVTGRDTVDFFTHHDRFVRALDPRREAAVRVTRPDGRWREIPVRYASGADFPITLDPAKARRAVYGITWATADPFWRGPEEVLTFGTGAVHPFFPGPPFQFSAGQSLATSRVVNPGDENSYPVWRVSAPFTGFSVGVADSLVVMDLTKDSGYIDIDMNPNRLTILDEDGVERWDAADEFTTAPIPPGTTVLTTKVDNPGTGSAVELTYEPRYRRGW
jgi:hypothetical protein